MTLTYAGYEFATSHFITRVNSLKLYFFTHLILTIYSVSQKKRHTWYCPYLCRLSVRLDMHFSGSSWAMAWKDQSRRTCRER